MKSSREKAHIYLEEVVGHQCDSIWNSVGKLTVLLEQYAAEREEKQREACISSMKKLVQAQNWNYADAIFDALYKACEDARIEE